MTDRPSTPERLEQDAANVLAAFRRIHAEQFADDPLANPVLEVEVIPAAVVEGPAGTQSVVVLITPWGMNGLVLPGVDLPPELHVAGVRRAFMPVEVPETGPYAQIGLVPDVSKYTSQEQARTIAESMIPVLLAGLAPEPQA